MLKKQEPIWNQIEEMVDKIPGWTPIDQLYSLYVLAASISNLEGDIVEIGSWCGRSSVVLGHIAKSTNSMLHCVDLFPSKDDWYQNSDGSYSFNVNIKNDSFNGYTVQTVFQEPFENSIAPVYEDYNSVLDAWKLFITREQLLDCVKYYQGDSKMFMDSMDKEFKIKLAFLDADHSYESLIEDIGCIEKHLVSGGIICFDDAFSGHYPGVDRAIENKIINSDKYSFHQQLTRKFFIAKRK